MKMSCYNIIMIHAVKVRATLNIYQVLRKAAEEADMSVDALCSIPAGTKRRAKLDDVTVLVIDLRRPPEML